MKLNILPFFLLLFSVFCFGQKLEYSTLTIPDSLKQNANAVVRLSKLNIDITSQKSMVFKTIQVTTVLNELGLRNLGLYENYDKNTRINKIEATTYNAFGNELKVFKRKDFKDISVADGISVFNDNRALYLDYTPITYPFTMVFEVETETSNTAFIPSWSPMDDYLVSTESTSLTINFKSELKLKIKEANFSDKFHIEKQQTENSVSYKAKNLIAKKREELSPGFSDVFPIVYFALENFHLENVDGEATNWEEFGKWYYSSLLADTEEIPEETQVKIKQLVGNEKDPIEIARIIYKFVQDKTRYVSVQVGIGGWKPMLARDVDKLGYGDCKALSNYTRSLLKVVGVPSYYTVVYAGDDETKDLQNDFASIQGNHVILTLPIDKKMVWLECTSQIQPFGFQGDFTDDRNVLLIKPEGGEIVRTKIFAETDNVKTTKGYYQITESGNLTGKVKIISKALRYDSEFGKERMSREDQIKNYKEEFDNINNLTIKKINFNNNPKTLEFTEDLELEAEGYAQNTGGKLMFALNAFDQSSYVPKKYRTREFPFQMERGYTNEDEIEITIPDGFVVEAKPNGTEQETEFGYYKIEFNTISSNKILCKKKLVIKKGFYDKSKYESYRKFRETIAKTDNSKIVITKA
ncbi:transglutaminase family protein [Flavobacterium sp. AS60]|uniref:transglutaminase-like domain-containing protein n=1 Tax=Flavobacterium anseongense TaxID=2910677 RepID=UPI001F42F5E8|nr:transglutaminase family protein [Flavobacterium sp. AS60]MCF6129112.1 transglutaminase family protein [Flavobacterium sp. AS60]